MQLQLLKALLQTWTLCLVNKRTQTLCACRCELEPTSADMGNVFYATRKELHIRLLNPGQVAANFQFMPLPGSMFGNPGDKEFRSTPRWATVHPEQVGLGNPRCKLMKTHCN